MRCENCGQKLPKGCTFCKHCNTPVRKKQTLIEKIGKVPIIIACAVVAIAAVGVLFFALTNVPAVKYEAVPASAMYFLRSRDTNFFDTQGKLTGTAGNVTVTQTNDLGTMFMKTTSGELFIACPDSFETADTGISDTRAFMCARSSDTVYYEKDSAMFVYDGSAKNISKLYGIVQFLTVSPDGSCAAWGTSERGVTHTYVYRSGNVEELSGADEISSVTDDGSLMFGFTGEYLVMCSGNSRSFEQVCRCGGITYTSADCTQVMFKDEHNPAATYVYDSTLGEKIFLYDGSVNVYAPDGMRPVTDSLDLFTAQVVNHKAGTQSLVLFNRDGAKYKIKTLLDTENVRKYSLSADGSKVLCLKDGALTVKNILNSFSKENTIAQNVYDVYANSTLSDIYFITDNNELYWSNGGTPEKLCLNVGTAKLINDSVCAFASDGYLYYSEHGSDIVRAEGIDKIKFFSGGIATSEDEEQYITFDGKKFINTAIKRY